MNYIAHQQQQGIPHNQQQQQQQQQNQPHLQQRLPQPFPSQVQLQPHSHQLFDYQQQQQQQAYPVPHNEGYDYYHHHQQQQQQASYQQHLPYFQQHQPPQAQQTAQAQLLTPLLQLTQHYMPPQPQQQQPFQQLQYVPPLYQQVKPSPLIDRLASVLPHPPLSLATITSESLSQNQPKRLRRRSKYTKEQDEMIVQLKKEGRSWVSIADITGVGSFLAARNRYQVLIGQQGGGTSECNAEDIMSLQSLLDEGEMEKWRFISKELYKSTGKEFSERELQDIVRTLFWSNPESFGITEDYLNAVMKIKSSSTKSAKSSATANSSIHSTSSRSSSPVTDRSPYIIPSQVDQFTPQQRFQEDFYPPGYQYNQ